MTYADYVYEIVKLEFAKIDALYEDYIIHLIGTIGLKILLKNKCLETCGVVNGRQLYALCSKDK